MPTPLLSPTLILAQQVEEAARQLQRLAGRYVPADLAESLAELAENIVRVADDPQGELAILAEQAFWLGHGKTSLDGYAATCQRLLPAHAGELETLARTCVLLLHLHLWGEKAAQRPISVEKVHAALLIADFIRTRRTPPPKPPVPPAAAGATQAPANLPQTPAATVLAKLPARADALANTPPGTGTLPPPAAVEMHGDDPADKVTHPPGNDASLPQSSGSADVAQRLRAVVESHHAAHPDQPLTLRTLQRNHGFDPATVRTLAAAHPDLFAVAALPVGAQGGRPSEALQSQNP